MDPNLQARVRDLVQKNDKIAICVGKNPTLDDMAAVLSLFLGLQQLNKKAAVATPTQPLVEHSSLVGIDKVKSQFEGESGDLIVSFPYREGEIEKVSYTIENGFLNIVVKAGEQGLVFKEQDVRYARGGGTPQLLFIVGTARLADLGSLFNPEALKDTTIVNIDNKIDNQGFGDVVLVSPVASSVSEIVGQLLLSFGIDIDIDTSQNLLSGISFATENFQSPKTSYVAFEMAAVLMRKGATRRAPAPVAQNEDRVSSFMPEQMISTAPAPRQRMQPQFNPLANQPANSGLGSAPMTGMPQSAPTQQSQQPMPRPAPMQNQQVQQNAQPQQQMQQNRDNRKPPSDWLTPKVYKGSSNV